MYDPVASEQDGSFSARRAVALALVGALVVSAVGGVIGSSGIAAAQQGGTGNTTTAGNATAGNASGGGVATNSSSANPVRATIQQFKNTNVGYNNLSAQKKQKVTKEVRDIANYSGKLRGSEKIKMYQDVYNAFGYGRTLPFTDANSDRNKIANILDKHFKVQTTAGVPPKSLPPKKGPLSEIDLNIPTLVDRKLKSLADAFKKGAADTLGTIYNLAFSTPVPENDGWHGIFGEPTNATGSGENATNATGSGQNVTRHAMGSGGNPTNATNASNSWGQVLGISSDKTYNQLHQQLLMDKLYPLLNYVLGIGVVVLGLSLTVNPLMSRFRIINLITKFVTFLVLYAFSWGTITLMHGVVNDITMWLRPSSAELQSLVANFDKIGAASVAAYFAGSGGIFSTVVGMGLELAVRHLALVYFLPYVFPVLVLMLYLSPWQRLKSFASMGIWQYVNILTMVIPMAVFLKAAVIVNFSPTNGIGGILVLLALFGLAVIVPVIQTYFFIQIPGTAAWAAKSAGSAAASRLGIGGGDDGDSDDSSADSTATGSTSPGARAESAVETTSASSSSSSSGLSSSGGKLSDDALEQMDPAGNSETTTAAKVRALNEKQHHDPNNADAKYEAYYSERENRPQQTTLTESTAD